MRSRIVLYVLLAFAGLAYLAATSETFTRYRLRYEQRRNELNIGAAKEPIDVPIQALADFDFKSREEVLDMRIEALAALRRDPRLNEVLPATYSPTSVIFNQIESGAPWWGLHGIFFFGPGQRSIDGPSEESRFLLNPLLLVGLVESRAFITNVYPDGVSRYFPRLEKLTYSSPPQTVTASYDVHGYLQHLRSIGQYADGRPNFSLSAYNARDFGFNYMAINLTRSKNVLASVPRTTVVPIIHYIHRGGSCGYPGGCNNMSPYQREIDFNVISLPAEVVVKLWKESPVDPQQLADVEVVLNLS